LFLLVQLLEPEVAEAYFAGDAFDLEADQAAYVVAAGAWVVSAWPSYAKNKPQLN
jgi:hypothetical protein